MHYGVITNVIIDTNKTSIIYNTNSKSLDITPKFHGKGKCLFTITADNRCLSKVNL